MRLPICTLVTLTAKATDRYGRNVAELGVPSGKAGQILVCEADVRSIPRATGCGLRPAGAGQRRLLPWGLAPHQGLPLRR
jgi:hypothetical protein